jgi:hypothetical protein
VRPDRREGGTRSVRPRKRSIKLQYKLICDVVKTLYFMVMKIQRKREKQPFLGSQVCRLAGELPANVCASINAVGDVAMLLVCFLSCVLILSRLA